MTRRGGGAKAPPPSFPRSETIGLCGQWTVDSGRWTVDCGQVGGMLTPEHRLARVF